MLSKQRNSRANKYFSVILSFSHQFTKAHPSEMQSKRKNLLSQKKLIKVQLYMEMYLHDNQSHFRP